ncbi:MAG: lipid A deacylase LpxR family protein [Alphaproteobacteria bacterium]
MSAGDDGSTAATGGAARTKARRRPPPSPARMPRRAPRTATVAVILAMAIAGACTETAATEEVGTLSFTLDNDLFAGSDRYYTNGVRLAWRSPAASPPGWLAALEPLGRAFMPPDAARRWGLALGQSLFTPEDIARENPDPDDRPYAAWLYGAVNLSSAQATSLSRLELQLGVVGPAALGEEAQNTVHRINRGQEAEGWDFQLANEPGGNAIASRIWRYNHPLAGEDGFAVGALPSLTASLGNVQTHAAAGLLLRAGWGLNADFGPPRIRPSVTGSAFVDAEERSGGYVFAGVEGRAVARDLFLDGNTFQDSRSVDKKPLVTEASVGAAWLFPGGRLSYTHVFRTEEFRRQESTSSFGSLSLSLNF